MKCLKPIVVLLLLTIPACSQIFPKRVYLIPEGTHGYVFILHNIPTGEKIEEKSGKTIFSIPESRILVMQGAPNSSAYLPTFYYIGKDGKKTLLDQEHSSLHSTDENLVDKRPFIFGQAIGIKNSLDMPCEIKFETFYVGTRALLLARTHEDREKEHSDLETFVITNAERICEGKPKTNNSTIAKPKN